MRKRVWFGLFGLLLALGSLAQPSRITGNVTDAAGQALPGVSVLVKGTTQGSTTDVSGNYAVQAAPTATLVFSMVGYVSQDVAVGNRTQVNVQLRGDARQLEEVVVVGFGTQTRRDLTGSVSSIKPEQVTQIPTANFQSSLQGAAPGINVVSASGAAGAPPRIRIRGSGSFFSNAEPFFVIDGVPVDSDNSGLFGPTSRGSSPPSNPMANIDPNDIESIEVLKDAAASSIYGARAANGVILITTKRGRAGKTRFNASVQAGVSSPTNRLEYADGQTYMALRDEAIRNATGSGLTFNGFPGGVSPQFQNGGYDQWFANQVPTVVYNRDIATRVAAQNLNHFDDVFVPGSNKQLSLSAQGGSEKTQFFVNVGLYDEQGILSRNDFQRANARVNIDHQATQRLKIGVQVSGSYTKNNMFPIGAPSTFAGGFLPGGFYAATASILPIFPRLNDDGSYFAPANSLSLLAFRDKNLFFNTTENQRYLTNLYGEYKLTNHLTWRTELGNDFIYQQVLYYQNPQLTVGGLQQGVRGINDYRTRATNNFNTNNYLTYNRLFAQKHTLTVTAGTQYNTNNTQSSFIQSNNIPAAPSLNTTQVAALIGGAQNRLDEFAYLSFFGRVNYKFDNRYLLGLSYRADASSRFGADNRWAYFPSVSAGWVLSEESFLKTNNTLTFLKLRASLGTNGNSNPGSIEPIAYGGFGINQAFYGDYIGHPYRRVPELARQLKWEKTTMLDVAVDFGLLRDRFNGTVNYYSRNTDDMILGVNPAPASGIHGGRNFLNVGSMVNRGVELNLAGKIINGKDFRWQADLNLAYNVNKITNLGGLAPTALTFGVNRGFVGLPLTTYFLPQFLGVDPQTGYEIFADLQRNGDGSPVLDANGYPTHDPSKPIVVDFLGRIAGTTTNVNWENLSAPIRDKPGQPFWTGGLTNTFSYKGLSVSGLFSWVGDVWIYDAGARDQAYLLQGFRNVQQRFVENRWQKPGDVAENPGFYFNPVYAGQNSTRFLENGSFVRLRNLRVAYNLPGSLTQKLHMDKVSVFANATNLLTFTKFRGWDPEVAGQAAYQDFNAQGQNLGPSQTNGDPPQPKTWVFGVNLSF